MLRVDVLTGQDAYDYQTRSSYLLKMLRTPNGNILSVLGVSQVVNRIMRTSDREETRGNSKTALSLAARVFNSDFCVGIRESGVANMAIAIHT